MTTRTMTTTKLISREMMIKARSITPKMSRM